MTINVIVDDVLLRGLRVGVIDRTAQYSIVAEFVELLLSGRGMDVPIVGDEVRLADTRVAMLDSSAIPTIAAQFVELLERRRARLQREEWSFVT